MPTNMIVVTPDRNIHSTDFKGAFEPESLTFMQVVPGKHALIKFDASKSMQARQNELFQKLDVLKGQDFSGIAFFCHGWHDGIQAGIRLRQIPEFVQLVCAATKNGVDAKGVLHVPLYCCSTAAKGEVPEAASETGGDGGFADTLRDEFCRQSKPWVRVYGHTTAGHTTMNPQVRVFEGKGSPIGGNGGEVLVRQPPPKNPLWPVWRDALAGKAPFDRGTMTQPAAWFAGTRGSPGLMDRKHLRFCVPFMTIAELHGILAPDGVV
jgi:hypothetical protein